MLECAKGCDQFSMYVEDCIWVPDILVKLFVKHHVTQKEVEEIFSTVRNTVLLNQDIGKGKMCIPLLDRQMPAATWLYSSFRKRKILRSF